MTSQDEPDKSRLLRQADTRLDRLTKLIRRDAKCFPLHAVPPTREPRPIAAFETDRPPTTSPGTCDFGGLPLGLEAMFLAGGSRGPALEPEPFSNLSFRDDSNRGHQTYTASTHAAAPQQSMDTDTASARCRYAACGLPWQMPRYLEMVPSKEPKTSKSQVPSGGRGLETLNNMSTHGLRCGSTPPDPRPLWAPMTWPCCHGLGLFLTSEEQQPSPSPRLSRRYMLISHLRILTRSPFVFEASLLRFYRLTQLPNIQSTAFLTCSQAAAVTRTRQQYPSAYGYCVGIPTLADDADRAPLRMTTPIRQQRHQLSALHVPPGRASSHLER
ncbi:hypothetical protein CSAL01_03706 [Colletotrichum salicis]|uniref:Uncharacterized protein n=1 Tax=Colletotrichum salicis TaxID=1209931 RepID=A0A135V5T8_9PEZI|nr:hypothetical protein CSAL01_03706 [Colletotrichum salicis]